MFARIFALVPFVLLASASHLEARDTCSGGSVQCCNQEKYNNAVDNLGSKAVLAAIVADLGVDLGLQCSPVSVAEVGGNSCTQQAVCCKNNSFNGVVDVGCTPINVNA